MITGIAIENFKGIRDRVSLELKPITLLFGPNSAGKSTILHALHYAREIFERHNLDPGQTVVGGKFIDLGGFRTLVHGHNPSRSVVLRFDLQFGRFVVFAPHLDFFDRIAEFACVPVDDLFTRFKTAAVTVEIAFSSFHDLVYVRRYEVEFDGRFFAEIRHDPDRKVTAITRLDLQHPVLLRPRDTTSVDATEDELEGWREIAGDLDRTVLESCLEEVRPLLPFTGDGSIPVAFLEDALPDFDRGLRFVTEDPVATDDQEQTQQESRRRDLLDELMVALSRMILIPGKSLKSCLEEMCYLGPLRETLPRNFSPVSYPDPSRWANGFAAWDLLFTDLELARRVSEWMSGQDCLGLGYTRLVQRGKNVGAFVSTLASYAARAVRWGRRVCGMEKAKDVLSPRAQRKNGFSVSKLPDYSTLEANPLSEALIDNRKSPVPDQVAFRIDFPRWLRQFSRRERRMILAMARNERTRDLAKKFRLTPGRISQLRREFEEDWRRFTAEAKAA